MLCKIVLFCCVLFLEPQLQTPLPVLKVVQVLRHSLFHHHSDCHLCHALPCVLEIALGSQEDKRKKKKYISESKTNTFTAYIIY